MRGRSYRKTRYDVEFSACGGGGGGGSGQIDTRILSVILKHYISIHISSTLTSDCTWEQLERPSVLYFEVKIFSRSLVFLVDLS